MIQVMIVDDEEHARSTLARLVEEEPDFRIVGQAASGDEALRKLKEEAVDVIFLDVEMPDLSGLDVASQLARFENPPLVVFATAYDKYAIEAFEANAMDYILKPFESERLGRTFARIRQAVQAKESSKDKLSALENQLVTMGRLKRLVGLRPKSRTRILFDPKEVYFFQIRVGDVHANLGTEELVVRMSLKDILASLDPSQFVRIHKSYIVNVEKVTSLEPLFHNDYKIDLKGPKSITLPLSRRYAAAFKALLKNW